MITVSVVLIIVFNSFFPPFRFRDRWKEARLISLLKDGLLVLDRTNNLYKASISSDFVENFFSTLPLSKRVVWWSSTENLIPSTVIIACNCTKNEEDLLTSWFNRLEVNGRNVSIQFVSSSLDKVNEPSNALLIIGYKNLTPYTASLESYLHGGKGIIEVSDIPNTIDYETRKIFGIDRCENVLGINCTLDQTSNISFIVPANATVANYQTWKLFFHFPETLKALNETMVVPTENGIPGCGSNSSYNGMFTLDGESFMFWICHDSLGYRVYWDTNGNQIADTITYPRQEFSLNGFNFTLSYVINDRAIAVAFHPERNYNFTDFLTTASDYNPVYPTDKNIYRIVLKRGNYNGTTYPVPAMVVNEKNGYRSVWIANFSRDGLTNVTDDEKMLFLSALLYAIDKKTISFVAANFGYQIPYINVVNSPTLDMFEDYTFYLGVGSPY